jgi:hypothetical protein
MLSLIELALDPVAVAPLIARRDISRTLGPHEISVGNLIGQIRDEESRRNGYGGQAISREDRQRRDIYAAGAEIAVASYLGLYPNAFRGSLSERACADVGPYQVRNTQGHCLYLYRAGNSLGYRATNPADRYVLVIGKTPTYRIVGWLDARDGMRDEYWRTDLRCPCWAVPEDRMHSFLVEGKR